MTNIPDTDRLRQELASHLSASNVYGLPERWFTPESGSRPLVTPSVGAEATRGIAREASEPITALPCVRRVGPEEAATDDGPLALADEAIVQLRAEAESCRRCRLRDGCSKVVFGVGKTRRPLIAFVGEGPGADEDRVGEPFVGKAGQLLTAAITKGLGLRREDVYICNVVKCRPPGNRAPLPDEVAACTPYLFRQLELVNPSVIVTLGQPAQLALSGVSLGITKLRGTWQEWRGVPLMPTFHPAYILRNPPAKRYFWEDLQAVMGRLGMPAPGSRAEGGDAHGA